MSSSTAVTFSVTGSVDDATAAALGLGGAAPAASSSLTGLTRGNSGPAVAQLQRALQAAGITVAGGADGIFGPGTLNALKAYQSAQGLSPTGIVDDATAAGLVADAPGSPGHYRFVHDLVRESLGEALPPAQRAALHRRIVETIEDLHADDLATHVAALAYHALEAARSPQHRETLAPRAVDYARQAGDQAMRSFAWEEAARLYRTAIAVGEGARALGDRLRFDLLMSHGEAESREGNLGVARDVFARAVEMGRRMGSSREVATAVIEVGGGRVTSYPASYDDYVYRITKEIDAGLRATPGSKPKDDNSSGGDGKRDGKADRDAQKRLKAVEEYSELGAGFKIAMRDLEIRGAGNILGTEQSGHIASVGYELYCQLLENAVRRLKNEPLREHRHVAVDLPISAYFPSTYVPPGRQKIEVYRKLSGAGSVAELGELENELPHENAPASRQIANSNGRIVAGRGNASGFLKGKRFRCGVSHWLER